MRCEQGYLCDVCGEDVEEIVDSDLYLSFVIGRVPTRDLPHRRERHIRCNPAQAQFIVDEAFPPVVCDGPFAKQHLDPAFVRSEEALLTRGWQRLQQLPTQGGPLAQYRLPELWNT